MMARVAVSVYFENMMLGVFRIYLLVMEESNEKVEYEPLKVELEFI
jgi:hypothetical protein